MKMTTLISYDKIYEIWEPKTNEGLFRIEAIDGSHLVDMIFDNKEQAQNFITKYNVPIEV